MRVINKAPVYKVLTTTLTDAKRLEQWLNMCSHIGYRLVGIKDDMFIFEYPHRKRIASVGLASSKKV